ncbi:unnamed protein product [Vitrella brassicaformis CCMP3155]|uniref:Ionotropic glutamate receptor C-terminal domain-containing protein n=1 Tax=Vitrella brassicaformis (strain CCMP3155) TaxID=1169540 RepID=A0A0G4FUF5_VITBC|nr:unnamed protein product [Vitrella brassicaformis CCMP3155]|eukprot:CEM18564.1 unnamed protein product [Vitrella brassicaformis CCMP3155]
MLPFHFLLLTFLSAASAQTSSTDSPDLSTSTPDFSTTLSTSPEPTSTEWPSEDPADSYLGDLNSTTGLVDDPRAVLRGRDIKCFITWFRGDSRSAYWLRYAVNKFHGVAEDHVDVEDQIREFIQMDVDERIDVTHILTGVNLRLMKWIAFKTNANLKLYAVNERAADPESDPNNSSQTDPDYWRQILYHLNPPTTPQYDCALESVFLDSQYMDRVRFLTPHVPAGRVLVVLGPVKKAVNALGLPFAPFSWEAWTIIAVSILYYAVSMCLFEWNQEEMIEHKDPLARLAKSSWLTITTFTQLDGHTPNTWAGRFLQVGFALFVVLIVAAWTANLTAFLTNTQTEQKIKSIEDVRNLGTDLRMCYSPWEREWLESQYKDVHKVPRDI